MDPKPLTNLLEQAKFVLHYLESTDRIDMHDPVTIRNLRHAIEDVDKMARETRDRLDLKGHSQIPLDELIRAEQEAGR